MIKCIPKRRRGSTKPSGHIIYSGPSLLDGSPIVVVAIIKSKNTKTANMIQTYIIRSDMDPREANRTGADFAICGHCPHRGMATAVVTGLAKKRTCYVLLGQGPLVVFRTMQRGR